jgi:hypothetical protein
LLEVLDMAEASGVEPEALATLLKGRSTARKMRMLFALAWVVARRATPDLAYATVCTWKLEVIGEVKENPATAKRAALVVGAAKLAGVTPTEAGNLTVAEIGAYAARNRKRRAG